MSPGTGNRTTRVLGLAALATVVTVVVLGLVVTPPDEVQGDLVRLIYVHPAVSTWAFVAFGVTALASLLYFWPATRGRVWDQVAGSSAEVGVVFCALSLATGSIWGRPAWGVWWTWDARLTLTALLCALFLGYLALRRTGGPIESRAKRSAIAGVLFSVVVPIDHYATDWWRTLHQRETIDPFHSLHIHGSQLWTMVLSFTGSDSSSSRSEWKQKVSNSPSRPGGPREVAPRRQQPRKPRRSGRRQQVRRVSSERDGLRVSRLRRHAGCPRRLRNPNARPRS